MNSILVAFDIAKLGDRYAETRTRLLATCPRWCDVLPSTIIVKTDLTPEQVRDAIVPPLLATDELLVVRLEGHCVTNAAAPEVRAWLDGGMSS